MKEYINKQLEEQIGKMIDDLAQGNFNQVEQRFETVKNFVLHDEKIFTDGVKSEEASREKEMEEIRGEFVKAIETALGHEAMDDKVLSIVQAFDTLQGTEQKIMGKYINDLVESVVSYKRKIVDKDNKATKATAEPTDDMDKFLDKQ